MKMARLKSMALYGLPLFGLLLSGSAQADSRSPACPAQSHHPDPVSTREAAQAHYEALSQDCLKAMVVQCSAQASERLLDSTDAATCSLSYEALLKSGFAGDFKALLAWWRQARDSAAASR